MLQEHLLPAAVPRGTCRLQLWDELVPLEANESLRNLAQQKMPHRLILTARIQTSKPECGFPDCKRCAEIADAVPAIAALRRRRHFWCNKRPAFMLRHLEAEKVCSFAVFFHRTCPDEPFR